VRAVYNSFTTDKLYCALSTGAHTASAATAVSLDISELLREALSLGIAAPLAAQRAALQEYRRADAVTVDK